MNGEQKSGQCDRTEDERPKKPTRQLGNGATDRQAREHYSAMLDYWIAEAQWQERLAKRLQAELTEARRCKHPTKQGTGSISSEGKIVTSELWCDTCGEKLT